MDDTGGGSTGPIDVPVTSSGAEGVDRIVTAIDRLHAALEGLGSVAGLSRLAHLLREMQASMTTGFAELSALAQKGGNEVVEAYESTSRRVLTIEQKRDVDLNRLRQQALTDYVGWWDKMLDIEQQRDVELNAMRQKASAEYVSWWGEAAAEREAIEQRRDIELHAMRQREQADYASWWEKTLAIQEAGVARQIEIEQRRDIELHAMRQRATVDAELAAERQRALNTGFLTASPASQLRAAVQAQTYAGMGGDAVARYGSLAAAADVNALRAAHEALAPAVNSSRGAVEAHNHAMNEAHSLARGLAGSLGGLWLTYGSLVPLAAGAAIAASLKNVVSVGAQVEHQLTNVLALTSSSVNLDQFLQVSDGSLRSLVEGANAMRMLAQNGLSASQSLQVLPSILDLATVGEMTVGQAALAATGAASAFGLGYSEAGRIADIFAVTAANSNTSVVAMTESMKQASTVASLFKVSIEETAGMLGLLAKINVTGGAAGTSLTNMLNGLYEPTEKGKRALKELGVETHTATGALKPLTKLLEDMHGALSRFDDSSRVDLLGSIFTVRGVKSAQLALENLDDFKTKTHEAATATGFMAGVVQKLEDDTTGGFERLGVTVQNSLVRSFAEASPYVQHMALELGDMFKEGGGAATGLQNFATNVARLTGALVDNLGAVTLLGVGYVGLRALGPTVEIIKAATAASAAQTVAETAAAAASATHATAMSAGAATTATYTAMVETNTAATEAATVATAAWEATLLPVLAAVGVALGVAGAAWLLFRDNTDEADKTNQKITNSLHVVNEALEREIKQLEKANDLWDKKNGKYLAPETVAPGALDAARTQVANLEAQARKQGLNPEDLRNPTTTIDAGSGMVSSSIAGYEHLADSLTTADENLRKLLETQKRIDDVLNPAKAVKGVHDATAQLREELEKFAKVGTETNSSGQFYQQNAAVRAIHLQAGELEARLLDPSQVKQDVKAEQDRIAALRVDLKQLQDQSNALLSARAPQDHKEIADAYRAQVTALDEELQQAQKKAQTTQRDLESDYKTGAISAVEAAQKEHDAQIASLNTAIDVAHKKAALAAGQENGKGGIASAHKAETAARAAMREADAKLDRDYDEIVRKQEADATQYQIAQLRARGETAKAYQLAHAVDIAQTDKGIEDSRKKLTAALAAEDAKGVKSSMAMLAGFEEARARFDAALETATGVDAVVKAEKEFKSLFTTVTLGIDALAAKSAAGGGLSSVLGYALDAQNAYSRALPGLRASQRNLQDKATITGRPEDQTLADQAARKIDQEAIKIRKTWADVGKSIEKSLSEAFGKSGTAAGNLFNVMAAQAQREQAIRNDLDKSKGQDDYETKKIAAIRDLDAAQVSAYADMAGAAKGFFAEHSAGYQLMSSIEKAYHLAEVAMAAKTLMEKTFFKTTEVGVETTTAAAKVGVQTAATATSAALAGTEASAWGVTAVVKAIASMPFPLNLAAGAATLAAVVAIGAKVAGGLSGGADTTAADRQAATGTGTVFGDSKAKSDSVARAVQLTAANSNIALNYTMAMAASLHNIESSLSGLGNVLIRSGGLTGETAAIQHGTAYSLASSTLGVTAALGPISLLINKLTGGWIGSALGKIGNAIFGGDVHSLDTGLTAGSMSLGGVLSTGLSANQYTDTKRDGGLFHKDHYDTIPTALGAEASQQLTQVVTNMAQGVTEAGKLLGLGGDAFTAHLSRFVVDIGKISTKGLTGDEIQKKLEAAFSKIGDDMAKFAVGGLTQFSKVGEGYFETLTRVATNYANLNAVLTSIGMTFGATGMSSIAAREHLIDLAGGIDTLAQQANSFAQNFLTKAEQLAPVAKYVDEQLAALGATGIKTRDDFKHLVQGLNLTVPAQQQEYVALMALQDAFAKTHAATVDLTKTEQEVADERKGLQDQLDSLTMTQAQLLDKQRSAIEASNRALFDQVQAAKAVQSAKDALSSAYDTEKQSIQSTIDRLQSLSEGWKKFRDGLVLGDKSPLNAAQKYEEARNQYLSNLTLARSGDKNAQDQYQEVANAFLEASRAANASSQQYTDDFNAVLRSTDEATVWAQQQIDVSKQSLSALESSVSALISIKQGVLSVQQAIEKLTAVTTSYQQVSPNYSAIEQLYEALLGRQADQAGMSYWQQAMGNGATLDDVTAGIKHSSEYAQTHTGDVLYSGASLPGAQQAAAAAPASDAPTRAQMDAVVAELTKLREQLAQQAQHSDDLNADVTLKAAEKVADSVDQSATTEYWRERSRAYNL